MVILHQKIKNKEFASTFAFPMKFLVLKRLKIIGFVERQFMDFALSYKSMRNFLAKNSIKIVSQAPYASDFVLPVTFPFSQIQITTSRFEFVRD